MGTKRVQVPQDGGTIVLQHAEAGLYVEKKYSVDNHIVNVDDRHVAFFLRSVADSKELTDDVKVTDEKPSESDKTKK